MEKASRQILIGILLFFSALVAPLVLIPVEKILPYPYILEEIVKALFVILILTIPSRSFQIQLAVFIGVLFAFSENFFYLTNFIESGILFGFFQRILLTSFLHVLTTMIILLPAQRKRYWIFPALLLAILVHFFYNQLIIIFI